jgi:hypothetical protein
MMETENKRDARKPFISYIKAPAKGERLIDVSALTEARFHKSVKSGEVLFARSMEPV